jgi:hypothetical protein
MNLGVGKAVGKEGGSRPEGENKQRDSLQDNDAPANGSGHFVYLFRRNNDE